jgi:hypothetical protein
MSSDEEFYLVAVKARDADLVRRMLDQHPDLLWDVTFCDKFTSEDQKWALDQRP